MKRGHKMDVRRELHFPTIRHIRMWSIEKGKCWRIICFDAEGNSHHLLELFVRGRR